MKYSVLFITAIAITLLFSSCSKEKKAGELFGKFEKMTDQDSMLLTANNIYKEYPETKYGYMCKAYVFYKDGNLDSANEYVTKALTIDRGLGYCYLLRGEIFCDKEEYRIAIEDYSQCLKMKYKPEAAYTNIGACLVGLHNPDSAIIFLNNALLENKQYGDAYFFRGAAMLDKEEYLQAVQDFNAALIYDDKDWRIYNLKGIAHEADDDLEEALECYEKAIQLSQDDEVAPYVNRGKLYASLDSMKLANADFAKAISIDATKPGIYEGRAEMYMFQKKYNEAVSEINHAVELGSTSNSKTYLIRGICLYYLNKVTEALEDFNRSIELKPANDFALLWRAAIWYKKNETSKMCDDLRESARLGNEEAEKLLKKKCK